LPLSALDLDGGWVHYPRPKTGIERRCPLWPETIEALRAYLTSRPVPKDPVDAGLVFLTKFGGSWHNGGAMPTGPGERPAAPDGAVAKAMRKLLDRLNINGHRGFYALRHTFETIGGESMDQVATDVLMGHADDSMAAAYRERISDERLVAVTDHVRHWLFPPVKRSSRKTATRNKS
jgi:integrase